MKFSIKKYYASFQIIPFITVLLMCFIMFLPAFTHAIQSGVASPQLNAAGNNTGLTGGDPRIFIATMIQMGLGVLGTVFAGLMVLGGYWFLTANGRDDYIEKARKTMIRATIGLVIIMLAYSITTLVNTGVSQLNDSSGDSAGGRQGGGVSVSTCCMVCTRDDNRDICNFDTLRSNPDYVAAITPLPITQNCRDLVTANLPACGTTGSCNVITQVTSPQCTVNAR